MAKRFRDTAKFDRQWYMDLRPRLKCAADYILDKCDNAGVWQINMRLLNSAVNDLKKITLEEVLKIDDGNQFHEFTPGKIVCVGFIEFQYGELSEKCVPHQKVLEVLKKYNLIGYNKKSSTLPGRVPGTLKDKDKDKEEEKEKDVDKEKPGLVFPFCSDAFNPVWNALLKEKKWKGKSITALQSSLDKLSKYPESVAIQMMKDTIAGEWQGLFEPKNYKNGNKLESQQRNYERLEELLGVKGHNGTNGNQKPN